MLPVWSSTSLISLSMSAIPERVDLTCSRVSSQPVMVLTASFSMRRLFSEELRIAPLRFTISPESFSDAVPQLFSISRTFSEALRFSRSFLVLPESAMNTADIAAYSMV